LTGVAVNITLVPAQTGFSDAEMDTLAILWITVIVMEFDLAGFPKQPAWMS
jgi:hypothetical protein